MQHTITDSRRLVDLDPLIQISLAQQSAASAIMHAEMWVTGCKKWHARTARWNVQACRRTNEVSREYIAHVATYWYLAQSNGW